MNGLTTEELEEAGIPQTCTCGTELDHYPTKSEVHYECSTCGFEDVQPIGNLY